MKRYLSPPKDLRLLDAGTVDLGLSIGRDIKGIFDEIR
jgi:hypothetical protein